VKLYESTIVSLQLVLAIDTAAELAELSEVSTLGINPVIVVVLMMALQHLIERVRRLPAMYASSVEAEQVMTCLLPSEIRVQIGIIIRHRDRPGIMVGDSLDWEPSTSGFCDL
jgi:hypothetical protein